ncbi:MAG: pyruvate formate lyase-activating protein [Spirochaetaceae bacterium]|nr:MAG: pyruvate formate lyase-activating protein [Spirochaetaceae bacterium]
MRGTPIGGGLAGATDASQTTATIHSVETFGTVDGPGIRYVVFFQGCPLRCAYCHNRDTWTRAGGKTVKVADLAVDIERYAGFLRPSGGGVTATGGEPLLQAAAVGELFDLVHGLGLTTALDTSGHAAITPVIHALLERTDLVILDLKHADDDAHRNLVGVTNRRIFDFAREVARTGRPLWVRHVVVPGYTTAEADVAALGSFIAELAEHGDLQRVELLAYHELGRHKWEALGERYLLESVSPPTANEMRAVAEVLEGYGLPVRRPD